MPGTQGTGDILIWLQACKMCNMNLEQPAQINVTTRFTFHFQLGLLVLCLVTFQQVRTYNAILYLRQAYYVPYLRLLVVTKRKLVMSSCSLMTCIASVKLPKVAT